MGNDAPTTLLLVVALIMIAFLFIALPVLILFVIDHGNTYYFYNLSEDDICKLLDTSNSKISSIRDIEMKETPIGEGKTIEVLSVRFVCNGYLKSPTHHIRELGVPYYDSEKDLLKAVYINKLCTEN